MTYVSVANLLTPVRASYSPAALHEIQASTAPRYLEILDLEGSLRYHKVQPGTECCFHRSRSGWPMLTHDQAAWAPATSSMQTSHLAVWAIASHTEKAPLQSSSATGGPGHGHGSLWHPGPFPAYPRWRLSSQSRVPQLPARWSCPSFQRFVGSRVQLTRGLTTAIAQADTARLPCAGHVWYHKRRSDAARMQAGNRFSLIQVS